MSPRASDVRTWRFRRVGRSREKRLRDYQHESNDVNDDRAEQSNDDRRLEVVAVLLAVSLKESVRIPDLYEHRGEKDESIDIAPRVLSAEPLVANSRLGIRGESLANVTPSKDTPASRQSIPPGRVLPRSLARRERKVPPSSTAYHHRPQVRSSQHYGAEEVAPGRWSATRAPLGRRLRD
jgi:hypothetical protein